ncbi:DUF3105 domain-containing protein [Blastococcus sp. SYSU D00820]
MRRPLLLAAAALPLLVGCTATVDGTATAAVEPVTLAGTEVADYAAGQQHVRTTVDYAESPPVGGPHAPSWADCTGSVYDEPIADEYAVHSLEHGAVWITYDPDLASADDVAALEALTEGGTYRMLSPYPGLGTRVSLQAWNHALPLDDVADPRLEQFLELLTVNPDTTPEVGATCENPGFLSDPVTP